MEQPRTRPPQTRPRRTTPLPPQQGGPRRSAAVPRPSSNRPARPAPRFTPALALRRAVRGLRRRVQATRNAPNPRLTGLGSGLFCIASMLLLACLDLLLLDGSMPVYGVLFVLVSTVTALWVRRADLAVPPIALPIAFAVGVLPIADGTGGFGGTVVGLFTALATQAGWLYGGTLTAGLIVAVRKFCQLIGQFAARRRATAATRNAVVVSQGTATARGTTKSPPAPGNGPAPRRGPRPPRPRRRPA